MHLPQLPADPAAEFRDAMTALVRSLGLHKPDRTPCGQPVSVAEAHALLEVARAPGITQNGLARRLGLEKSTVSRVAAMLERRGWVRRRRDATDARFVRIELTARGVQANAAIAAARHAKFERIFRSVPAERRAGLLTHLALLVEATRDS